MVSDGCGINSIIHRRRASSAQPPNSQAKEHELPLSPLPAKAAPNGSTEHRAARGSANFILQLHEHLCAPAPTGAASTIGIFRALFGVALLAQDRQLRGKTARMYERAFLFNFPGFEFLQLPSETNMFALLAVLELCAWLLFLGIGARVAALVYAIVFLYWQHIDQINSNNHYYFEFHLCCVLALVRSNSVCSVPHLIRWFAWKRGWLLPPHFAVRTSVVRHWHVVLLQALSIVPYAGGCLAKMNVNWLVHGGSLSVSMPRKLAWLGLGKLRMVQLGMAWSGCVFDGMIGPLLFCRWTRYRIAFPAVLAFNFINKLIYGIGSFPYVMIAALVLFIDPESVAWLCTSPPIAKSAMELQFLKGSHTSAGDAQLIASDSGINDDVKAKRGRSVGKCSAYCFVVAFATYLALHIVVPLRHLLYPSDSDWTEEGHYYAWHMKRRVKVNRGVFLHVDADKHSWSSSRQVKLVFDPFLDPFVKKRKNSKHLLRVPGLLKYVHHIKMLLSYANYTVRAIRVEACVGLNKHPPRLLINSTADVKDVYPKSYCCFCVRSLVPHIVLPFESAQLCDHNRDEDLEIANIRKLYRTAGFEVVRGGVESTAAGNGRKKAHVAR